MASSGVFRRALLLVALLNFAYFGVELVMARRIGSVSLFADSVDFFEDAAINTLILVALGWALAARRRLGFALAGVVLLPAIAALWTAVAHMVNPVAPEAVSLSVTALGALAVNLTCGFILSRHRDHPGGLAKAAWLAARNDSIANVAILVAASVTAWVGTGWPDIIVGLGIAALNIGAAREVWEAARSEPDELVGPRA